jgi:hypothetical protein
MLASMLGLRDADAYDVGCAERLSGSTLDDRCHRSSCYDPAPMPVPAHQEFMRPLLELLRDGAGRSIRDVYVQLADHFQLSESDLFSTARQGQITSSLSSESHECFFSSGYPNLSSHHVIAETVIGV